MQLQEKNAIGFTTLHLISKFDCSSDRAKRLESMIDDVTAERAAIMELRKEEKDKSKFDKRLEELSAAYQWYKSKLEKRYLVDQSLVKNKTVNDGRTAIAERVAGTSTANTETVSHGVLGDDNTAPTVTDSALGNEQFRKALSDGNVSGTQAILELFVSSSDTNGTFEEYGFYMDGTGTTDSGVLLNRFTETKVKSNTESLNIRSTIDFTDV